VNGLEHSLGLVEGFLIFRIGVGIGDDPRPGLNEDTVILKQQGPNGNPEIQIAAEAEIAHRPAVGTPLIRFQLLDNLHRPDLGRPGQGACGKGGPDDVETILAIGKLRLHMRDKVHDMGITLHCHELVHLHAAGPGNPPEVVSSQIHKHHMFGLFLGVLKKFVGQRPVLLLRFAPPPSTGDGRSSATPSSRRTMTSGEEPMRVRSPAFRKKR